MSATIFIDGEAGTTGLQIKSRLEGRHGLDFIHLDDARRKDPAARREALNDADVVILCLPDDAAREAVSMIDSHRTRVIDASTAHRIADGWTYGFPEYDAPARSRIAEARFISNPGCYALASIAMLHPLVKNRMIRPEWPVTINAVSGYSGGGRTLIQAFEDDEAPNRTEDNFRIYSLGLSHKHLPEIQKWGGLTRRPLFMPSVGRFAQGMMVQLPLQLWSLPGVPTVQDIHHALSKHYIGQKYVQVAPLAETGAMASLDAEAMNGTNTLRLHVFGNEFAGQAVIVGVLDNLGKGASGQAVQNLNLMLGLPETEGLNRAAHIA